MLVIVQPTKAALLCLLYCALPQAILDKHLALLNREDVSQTFAESLTDVTLQLYSALLEKLPPTPSRFHYVFNLRDLSRVYEGLLRSTADIVQQPSDFLRLWRNEVRSAASL
jgi:dynein heavy chain